MLESFTGLSDTDTDTSIASWVSEILIPILVSLAGAQRYQYQYLVSKAQVSFQGWAIPDSFNDTDTSIVN